MHQKIFSMKKMTITLLTSLFFALHQLAAQSSNPDFFRSIGKIYVVVAVIVAMFIGIVIFLIYMERKLTKLENQINEK